jgi:hypothetical protein
MQSPERSVPHLLEFAYPFDIKPNPGPWPRAVDDAVAEVLTDLAMCIIEARGALFPIAYRVALNRQTLEQNAVNAKVAQRSTQGIFEKSQRVELANINWRNVLAAVDVDTNELRKWFVSRGFKSVHG